MKRLLFCGMIIFSLLAPALASAGEYYTKKNAIACTSKKYLDQAITYAVQKDKIAFVKMMDGRRCTIVKPGIKVFLKDVSMFSDMMEVRPAGSTSTLWMTRDGLDRR
ncbi:MAG: hypothetical protein KQI62_02060 [Deltaproteobacteria bacterium]|nr:hypothetical protein [Deltaproteobacteria bacterium]